MYGNPNSLPGLGAGNPQRRPQQPPQQPQMFSQPPPVPMPDAGSGERP